MHLLKRVLPLLVALAGPMAAQPVISSGGILNAASYAVAGLPNSSIAQGSIFVIFGSGLGPSTLQKAGAFPIPTTLPATSGTSVTISANGQTLQAPMIYTVAAQVAAILPSTTPVGSASVTVTYNGATSAAEPIQVVASSFGTFSVNQKGSGSGIVTNNGYTVFLANSAAKPGDAAIIWGTGLGAIPYSDAAAPPTTPVNLTNVPLELYVGGKKVNTVYQGRSGCCAGLDQIVFTVPSGVAEGCSVPVILKINSVVSNSTTMPISSASNHVCSDPNGINSTDLAGLLSKGSFSLGYVFLDRNTSTSSLPPPLGGTTTTDSGGAGFFKFTPQVYAGSVGVFQQPALGACVVNIFTSSSGGGTAVTPDLVGLDAGTAITVTGPGGIKQLTTISELGKGYYSGDLSSGSTLYLDPGAYQITNGSGGADVQGFSFTLNVAQPLTWTNMSAVSGANIQRSQGVTVTWTGGAPGTYVSITGTSVITGPPTVAASFECLAPVSAGTFTVGPDTLLQLPPSTVISAGGINFSTSNMSLANVANPIKFTAPGLDYGFASTSVSSGTSVTFQ